MNPLPPIIEPNELEKLLGNDQLIIVDLCKPETYVQAHIPGAIYLDYKQIIGANPPVMGLLPDVENLTMLASIIGLSNDKYLVSYDDEGGGKAARLLWTLNAMDFSRCSLLNGGIHAWANEHHPLEQTVNKAPAAQFEVSISPEPIGDKNFILENLQNETVALFDSRSTAEYTGIKKFAAKAGHIPGAVNIDWLEFIDQNNNARLKPESEIRATLDKSGLTSDKTVVTYCQTHHRSALTYWVLKALGYPNVKGYPGSWSDWGNSSDTPVEL